MNSTHRPSMPAARRGLWIALCLAIALVVGSAPQEAIAASTIATVRVSVSPAGEQGRGQSYTTRISADGRYVAYQSTAANLVAGDTNGRSDVFVTDTATGVTRLVSRSTDGFQGNDWSGLASISADGRFVSYISHASNLVTGDTNGAPDIFVTDTATGVTRLVARSYDDPQSPPCISADGRYVAYDSTAANLVAGDTNGALDIFVTDTATGVTRLVSRSAYGVQGGAGSSAPSMSADGRYVAYRSDATNLVAGDTNGDPDIFVTDTATGGTRLVSRSSYGDQGNAWSGSPSISADGRYVAYNAQAWNLVAEDTNISVMDIFITDTATGVTRLVSRSSDGTQGNFHSFSPSVSADGRYVTYMSQASNLVAGDSNGSVCDIFVTDTATGVTSLISTSSDGAQGNGWSWDSSISADGRYVAYRSDATNLVAGDTNEESDVFVTDTSPAPGPFRVTFRSYSGAALKTQTVAYGASATAPTPPARTGYTFLGWGAADLSHVTRDLNLTATYAVRRFHVSFWDSYGARIGDPQLVDYGKAATAPTPPTRAGAVFAGWDRPFAAVTSDLTVTAKWRTYAVVRFLSYTGGTLKTQNVTIGASATAPTPPARTGYTFTGWDTDFTRVTGDLTVRPTYAVRR